MLTMATLLIIRMTVPNKSITYFQAPAGEGKTYIYIIVSLYLLTYKLSENDGNDSVLLLTHNVTCWSQLEVDLR